MTVPTPASSIAATGLTLGIALAALAAFFLAAQSLFVRVGTDAGRSNDALFVVIAVNVVVFLPAAVLLEGPDLGLTPRAIAAFAGAGLVGTLAGRALLYAGIERVGASRAEPIKASMPLFAALIAVVALGETMTSGNLAGILLIVLGIGLISWESRGDRVGAAVAPHHLLLPLAAALFFGVEPILAKVGFAEGTPVLVGLTVKTTAAVVGLVGLQAVRGDVPRLADLRTESLRWYLAAGVASTAFLVSYYSALELAPVVAVTPIMQTSPLLVVVLSAVFLQGLERVTWRIAAAAGLVVCGAVVITVLG